MRGPLTRHEKTWLRFAGYVSLCLFILQLILKGHP